MKMKIYHRWEREYTNTYSNNTYTKEMLLKEYNEVINDRLQNIVWVENFSSDVSFEQGRARALCNCLGFNKQKTYPITWEMKEFREEIKRNVL